MNGLARRVTDDSSSSSWRRLCCTPVITSRTQTDDFHACVWRWRFSAVCDYDEIIFLGLGETDGAALNRKNEIERCYYDTYNAPIYIYVYIYIYIYIISGTGIVYTRTIDGNKSLVIYRQLNYNIVIFTYDTSLLLVIH